MADIFLDGMVARNRALNGDLVVVKLLPPDQWKVRNVQVHTLIHSMGCVGVRYSTAVNGDKENNEEQNV